MNALTVQMFPYLLLWDPICYDSLTGGDRWLLWQSLTTFYMESHQNSVVSVGNAVAPVVPMVIMGEGGRDLQKRGIGPTLQ